MPSEPTQAESSHDDFASGGRGGDPERGGAEGLRTPVLVEGVEFGDREPGCLDELDRLAGQMASAGESLLYRFESVLPPADVLVGREAVLDEVQASSWL